MKSLFLVLFCMFSVQISAQTNRKLSGIIKNEQGETLDGVSVKIENAIGISVSNAQGQFSLTTHFKRIKVFFSLTGYSKTTIEVDFGQTISQERNVVLKKDIRQLEAVNIRSERNRTGNTNINARLLENQPSASGNFESILKTLPGVSTNNELSSQYSVRGGNFDENLVYVNDIEIYRPFLVRNGQQEGLSFINPELASRVSFSAGGFEARYGDKMSSVLDVRYGKPDSSEYIASVGTLGLSATAKMVNKNNFTLFGIRQKTNQNLLKTQETTGAYQPEFYDIQFINQHDLTKKLSVSLMGDYNLSRFTLIPQSRETTFGTQDQVLRLHVDYDGQERDKYDTWMGAATFQYKASDKLNFKWINSAFNITERETFDIEGSYIFSEVETDIANPDFTKNRIEKNRGFGTSITHARNELQARIYNSELRSTYQNGRSLWETGVRIQHDKIIDALKEYQAIDSAGYILPVKNGPLTFADVTNVTNTVATNRIMAFLQNTYNLSGQVTLTAGLRGNYNSYTTEFLLSPRVSLAYRPKRNANLLLHFNAGSYNQPPFYRELRNMNGSLNSLETAQRSLHFLTGADYSFAGLGTILKLTSELYYKKLDNLVPYKIENLRIRYFANQQAKGYAAGADFSLSGEFVNGLESSFRLSLMKTEEDIKGDYYIKKDASGNQSRIEPGYLKRPTDQRINFSIFFQDRLFKSPTYKVHLNLLYGSALPIGPPQTERYADVFKIPAYRRVDIGFSKDVLDTQAQHKPAFLQKYLNGLIIYAEVFNLLNIDNTVSYLWIKDVNNNQYAIPNYLTSRQVNFRIIAKLKNKY